MTVKREVAEPRLALAPVAGDARQVVDQRQPPADQPVEQRRLADVRPADDGDAERAMLRGIGGELRGCGAAARRPQVCGAGAARRSPAAAGSSARRAPSAELRVDQASINWARWRRSCGVSWSAAISSKYFWAVGEVAGPPGGEAEDLARACGARCCRSRRGRRCALSRSARLAVSTRSSAARSRASVLDLRRRRCSAAIVSNSATAPALSPAAAFSVAMRKRASTG